MALPAVPERKPIVGAFSDLDDLCAVRRESQDGCLRVGGPDQLAADEGGNHGHAGLDRPAALAGAVHDRLNAPAPRKITKLAHGEDLAGAGRHVTDVQHTRTRRQGPRERKQR